MSPPKASTEATSTHKHKKHRIWQRWRPRQQHNQKHNQNQSPPPQMWITCTSSGPAKPAPIMGSQIPEFMFMLGSWLPQLKLNRNLGSQLPNSSPVPLNWGAASLSMLTLLDGSNHGCLSPNTNANCNRGAPGSRAQTLPKSRDST